MWDPLLEEHIWKERKMCALNLILVIGWKRIYITILYINEQKYKYTYCGNKLVVMMETNALKKSAAMTMTISLNKSVTITKTIMYK